MRKNKTDVNATQEVPLTNNETMDLPIQRTHLARLKPFMIPLVLVAIVAALATGFVVGYGVGKNHATKSSLSAAGWMLGMAQVNGVTLTTRETVYLSWDIAANPHDLGAVWYIIDPSKAHPLLSTIPIDAASNGQGGIIITLHTANGLIIITGTLNSDTLQLVIPPGSHLLPAANTAFVALTFAPSTTAAFNQLVGGA